MATPEQSIGKVINGKRRGIPQSLFDQTGSGTIKGLSERSTLEYTITETHIEIRDTARPDDFFFIAEKKGNQAGFMIQTKVEPKNKTGTTQAVRPLDLFAGKLLHHIVNMWGITTVVASWNEGTDNFETYIQHRHTSLQNAAMQTWTGYQLSQIGFTVPQGHIHETYSDNGSKRVDVFFEKTQ